MVKVVLAGPPQSGKSCLREGLKQAILTFGEENPAVREQNPAVPYPYVITACPDGEGLGSKEPWQTIPKSPKRTRQTIKANSRPNLLNLSLTMCVTANSP